MRSKSYGQVFSGKTIRLDHIYDGQFEVNGLDVLQTLKQVLIRRKIDWSFLDINVWSFQRTYLGVASFMLVSGGIAWYLSFSETNEGMKIYWIFTPVFGLFGLVASLFLCAKRITWVRAILLAGNIGLLIVFYIAWRNWGLLAF
ncbi:MAG: hypothetical protein LBM95_01145 [Lactobacillales bacterium]|nr:hypothetical protein [Lactobacillales bacterium]